MVKAPWKISALSKPRKDADEVSLGSSSDSVDGAPPTPSTDDAPQPAAPAEHKKYWPSDQEVVAVLSQLPSSDRELCDAAMANR
jgi:hypothetical protein